MNPAKMSHRIHTPRLIGVTRQPGLGGQRHGASRTDARLAVIGDLPRRLAGRKLLLNQLGMLHWIFFFLTEETSPPHWSGGNARV